MSRNFDICEILLFYFQHASTINCDVNTRTREKCQLLMSVKGWEQYIDITMCGWKRLSTKTRAMKTHCKKFLNILLLKRMKWFNKLKVSIFFSVYLEKWSSSFIKNQCNFLSVYWKFYFFLLHELLKKFPINTTLLDRIIDIKASAHRIMRFYFSVAYKMKHTVSYGKITHCLNTSGVLFYLKRVLHFWRSSKIKTHDLVCAGFE